MEAVGYAQAGHHPDGAVHHVAAACHHETHALGALEHLGSSLDEVFRPFLEGDTPEERHDLVLDAALDFEVLASAEVHGVMHGHDLGRVDAVFVDHYPAGEVADRYHAVGGFHAAALYGIHAGIDHIVGPAVEGGRMHVHHQRFAGEFFGGNAGKVGEPVVGVDDVEFILVLHRYGACHHRVPGNLFEEVRSVFAGELVFLPEADAEILHLPGAFVFYYLRKFFWVGVGNQVRIDVDEFHLVEEFVHGAGETLHRHVARIDDAGSTLVLVAAGRRHHEDALDAIVREPLDYTFAGSPEPSRNVRGKLPSEHQNSHFFSSLE